MSRENIELFFMKTLASFVEHMLRVGGKNSFLRERES
jgi:hypothetical protein